MSESYYRAHPVLSEYQVKHPINTIDLATHGSVAVVSTYISIILQIVHRGKPIRCKILIGIMKGLRYDLVLGFVVIASHYTDVLLDLLNLQLKQPSTASVSSVSMLGKHQATSMTKFENIWPASLDRWVDDDLDGTLYDTQQVPYRDGEPELHYSLQDPAHHDMTISLAAIPTHYPYQIDFNTAERYVLLSLHEELNSHKLPVITEEEADLLWKTAARTNRHLAQMLRELHFPTRKLLPLSEKMLLELIRAHGWDTTHYENESLIVKLRTFMQLIYHGFLDLIDYESNQVLEGKINVKLHDIINKLYTEAINVIMAENFAVQTILECPIQQNPAYLHNVTLIMVCRLFMYACTIDKIMTFEEEINCILEDHYQIYDHHLETRLTLLIDIPFRLNELQIRRTYDPNRIQPYRELMSATVCTYQG